MMQHHDDARHANDAVTRYLADRGVSAEVRRKGLRGVVGEWSNVASKAARYDLTLDDWLNDLDLRDIIAGALSVAAEGERAAVRGTLDRADEVFRAATLQSPTSLWGSAEGMGGALAPVRQWWYYRYPSRPGETMRADLLAAGIVRGD
jgi:hypothetical protein